jgi:hypothetical protein
MTKSEVADLIDLIHRIREVVLRALAVLKRLRR